MYLSIHLFVILQEFEIELEGSQCLRILCYEKCYDKSKINKDDNEIVDKIMGKGQVQVGQRDKHIVKHNMCATVNTQVWVRLHQTGLDHKRTDLNCGGFLMWVRIARILLLSG